MKRTALSVLLVASLAGTAACKKKVDLSALDREANGLVDKYAPKVTELTTEVEGLANRLKALPADQAGVAELSAKMTHHHGALDKVRALLGNVKAMTEAADKTGKREQVQMVIDQVNTEASTTIIAARGELEGDERTVSDLESKALAAATEHAPPPEFTKALTTGVEIHGNLGGTESELVAFIEDAARPVDKDTWFNFDRLSFKSGAAELDMEASKAQLGNLAEILKAYPKASLKIGGYTDNTGKPEDNKALSQARADNVVKAIVEAGGDKARLTAEGYGAEHPVCAANDTDDCKAQNRRIAVRVTAK